VKRIIFCKKIKEEENELSDLERQYKEVLEKYEKLKTTSMNLFAESNLKISSLTDTLLDMDIERDELSKRIDILNEDVKENEIDRAKRVDDLKAKTESLKTVQGDKNRKLKQLNEIKGKIQSLIKKSPNKTKFDTLISKRDKLRNEVAQDEKLLNELLEKIEKIRNRLKDKQNELDGPTINLKEKLDKKRSKLDHLQQENEQLSETEEELTKKFKELEKILSSLDEQIKGLDRFINESKSGDIDESKLVSLQEEIIENEEYTKDKVSELDGFKSEVGELEREKEKLKFDLKSIMDELNKRRKQKGKIDPNKIEIDYNEINNKHETLKTQIQNLSKSINDLENEIKEKKRKDKRVTGRYK